MLSPVRNGLRHTPLKHQLKKKFPIKEWVSKGYTIEIQPCRRQKSRSHLHAGDSLFECSQLAKYPFKTYHSQFHLSGPDSLLLHHNGNWLEYIGLDSGIGTQLVYRGHWDQPQLKHTRIISNQQDSQYETQM
jgi:hypothetical protein